MHLGYISYASWFTLLQLIFKQKHSDLQCTQRFAMYPTVAKIRFYFVFSLLNLDVLVPYVFTASTLLSNRTSLENHSTLTF